MPASQPGAEQLLFDVIATAYERHSVLVTTNLPFEHWTEVLGNERLTGAALDRLTHRCHILETKGESYRLKKPNTGEAVAEHHTVRSACCSWRYSSPMALSRFANGV